jgi:uncharacterized protein with FMN-binding domain
MEVKRMNKSMVLTAAITAVFSVMVSVFAMATLLRPVKLESGPVDLMQVADGEYIGFCQNKILFGVVRVLVKDHRMTGVEVLAHKESYMGYAKQTAKNIMESQSLESDSISGATFTCDTIKKAVENALKQGIQ